jgi:hypothetical protein
MGLANKILNRAPPPNKHRLNEWIEAAREETVKEEERMAWVGGYGKRNEIVRDNRMKKGDWGRKNSDAPRKTLTLWK